MSIGIIIPSYCPDGSIVKLVRELKSRNDTNVLVVDDGSGDDFIYSLTFSEVEKEGCTVIHHEKNLGKGAAIKTGIRYFAAHLNGIEGVVTADGDGQHLTTDIFRISDMLAKKKKSLVLGTRNFHEGNTPLRSRIGNGFSCWYFKMDTGMKCPDTQTGLRGIPSCMFELALETEGDRYDYEMNFLTAAAKTGQTIEYLPIITVYEDNNSVSHFRTIRDSYLVYKSAFRFAMASLTCAAVDLGLFTLVSSLLPVALVYTVLIATVNARLLSGGLNFWLNYKWSFSTKRATGYEAVKYFILFCAQMLASWGGVYALSFLPLPLVAVKMIVDSTLFVFSYFIQKNWVFAGNATQGREVAKG